jgi:hypothetical protein
MLFGANLGASEYPLALGEPDRDAQVLDTGRAHLVSPDEEAAN